VVLEWVNEGCPYVRKHYSGNMQGLQQAARADGVVWLTIASSAPGKQGYFDARGRQDLDGRSKGAAPTALLLDGDNTVATLYKAKTTPHMFVIDKTGAVVYEGAIDDIADRQGRGLGKTAKNLVAAALADVKAERKVATPFETPYGCSVKTLTTPFPREGRGQRLRETLNPRTLRGSIAPAFAGETDVGAAGCGRGDHFDIVVQQIGHVAQGQVLGLDRRGRADGGELLGQVLADAAQDALEVVDRAALLQGHMTLHVQRRQVADLGREASKLSAWTPRRRVGLGQLADRFRSGPSAAWRA
jgi:hypothetical protein